MKLYLDPVNLRPPARLDYWLQEGLGRVLPLVRVEAAHVRLEYRPEASPAYFASAHLVVPGPDLRVEAVDHTLRTVVAKVFAALRLRARERAARRRRRPRAHRRWPAFRPVGSVAPR